MHFNVHHIIQQYGYIGIFISLFLEMIGIPFPGETILTLSGIEWTKGAFSLIPLLLFATLGNVVGSTIAYLIGRYLGRTVILRYGKYVGMTEDRLNKAEERFNKYQITVLIFSKFIAGIRVLAAYLAGINKMQFYRFSFYNAIGSVVWVSAFVVFGRYIGIAWGHYHKVLHQYLLPIIILAMITIGLYVGMKQRRKRHKA